MPNQEQIETFVKALQKSPDELYALQLQLNEFGYQFDVGWVSQHPDSWEYKNLIYSVYYMHVLLEARNNQPYLQNSLPQHRSTVAAASRLDLAGQAFVDEKKPHPQNRLDTVSDIAKLQESLKVIESELQNNRVRLQETIQQHANITNQGIVINQQIQAVQNITGLNPAVTLQDQIKSIGILQDANLVSLKPSEIKKLNKDLDYAKTFAHQHEQTLKPKLDHLQNRLNDLEVEQKQIQKNLEHLISEQARVQTELNKVLNPQPKPAPTKTNSPKQIPGQTNQKSEVQQEQPTISKITIMQLNWVRVHVDKQKEEEQLQRANQARFNPRASVGMRK